MVARRVVAACALAASLLSVGCGGADSVPEGARETEDDVAAADLPDGDDATVTRIVDGDTLVVDGDVRIRLIGIDTPETKDPRKPVQCFGAEASRRIGELLPAGTSVRLVYDVDRTDRYDRTLAYVYRSSDALFVNAALVREGYAFAYTVPPDVAHADEFVDLERDAREADRGLWSACPVP